MVQAHLDVEDGYEFLAKRLLITVFSAPDHYGEFDNAGVTMTTDGDHMQLRQSRLLKLPAVGRKARHVGLRSILTIGYFR